MLPALQIQSEPDELARALAYYMDHPSEWVKDILNKHLHPYQESILNDLVTRRFVSVRSGHGTGKSFTLSAALLWFLATHPFSKVICTAPTKEQLYDVLWAQAHNHIRESQSLSDLLEWEKEKISVKSHPAEWFAVARTAEVRKLGKTGLSVAEGLQGRHAEYILYILDEASGIDETIMNTLDGALTTKHSYVLMAGNPTRSSGTFYDSFHTKRTMWATHHLNSEEATKFFHKNGSPQVDPDWCDRMLEKYGSRDHVMYLIRVRGEFPPAQHNSLFSLDTLELAMGLEVEPTQFDPVEIGVDVARYGGDLTCFCVKQGPKILHIDTYPQQSTMETVGRAIQYINKYRPVAVRVDVVGVGGGVYDRLRELGYKEVVAVNAGSTPNDDKQFINLRAEAHWNLRTMLEQKRLRLPKDDDLVSQMTAITYKVTSRGKIQVESKEDLRERGVKSPDRLDALVLACQPSYQPIRHARPAYFNFMAR